MENVFHGAEVADKEKETKVHGETKKKALKQNLIQCSPCCSVLVKLESHHLLRHL